MKNKELHREILRVTKDVEWMNSQDTVAYVQQLSRQLSAPRESPINYQEINGICVVYPDGNDKYYPSLLSCCEGEELASGTIKNYIRLRKTTRDGRLFRLL